MRLQFAGSLAAFLFSCFCVQAKAQDDPDSVVLPPLKRQVTEVGFLAEPDAVDSFWQDAPPPVPNPLPDVAHEAGLGPGYPDQDFFYSDPGAYSASGLPAPRYVQNAGDGYFPHAAVAWDACCAYESVCGDPTEYKLKVWTISDIGHELWNEILFGVIDPTCRFDPDCSQGPPTCCRKHGVGLLDFFPRHKERLLARRARACCGCSSSNAMYGSANPPGCRLGCNGSCDHCAGGYVAADAYGPQPAQASKLDVTEISIGTKPERTARTIFTVPTKMTIR
ncbi:MAG: hypothetical protein MPJ50_07840 [Pirellulales bacterium]|nr:hypothetical protein [Pirellulales bacterium]